MNDAIAHGITDFVNDIDPLECEKFEIAKKNWQEFWEWVENN